MVVPKRKSDSSRETSGRHTSADRRCKDVCVHRTRSLTSSSRYLSRLCDAAATLGALTSLRKEKGQHPFEHRPSNFQTSKLHSRRLLHPCRSLSILHIHRRLLPSPRIHLVRNLLPGHACQVL